MSASLVRVKYSGADFDTYQDEILARLQVKFAAAYNDFAISSLGIMLLDLFAFGLDTLSFYLDRRATDNFLSTARTRASVARAARQLGYKMGAATASSVDVEVFPLQEYTFPVTVPIGTRFPGPNGLVFESREAVTFPAGDTDVRTITLSEGETLSATFTSDGTSNQVFRIANVPTGKFVVGPGSDGASQVVVTVDGEAWEESDLLTFGASNQFEVGYNDSPPTLRFGDSIAGNIPTSGSQIVITYFATTGVLGRVTDSVITSTETALVVNFQTIQLSISNPEGASGGSDPESTEKAKANAPTVYASRGVNITGPDYTARATAFRDPVYGAISVAKAVTVRGSAEDAHLNSLLDDVRDEVENLVPTIETAVESALGNAASIAEDAAAAVLEDATLTALLTTLDTTEATATTAVTAARNSLGVTQTSVADIITNASVALAAVNAISTVGASQLTAPDRTAITNALLVLTSRGTTASTETATAIAQLTTVATSLDSIEASVESAVVSRASIRAGVDQVVIDIASATTVLEGLLEDVEAANVSVASYAEDIADHVDSFLSNECKSNLVEIVALTKDSDGFYVTPTIGLLRALQRYLDAKKEVTQVIKVTGAASILIAADIEVHVGVISGYNESSVRSEVEAAILGVLKDRSFGESLRESELYAPTSPNSEALGIEGVRWLTIHVTGPTDRIDGDGSLIISEFEIVTRGTITITSEVVSTVS